MQDTLNSNFDAEINLRKIFIILWSHKFIIIFLCAINIFFGINYALSLDKKYTSSATFKLASKSNGLSLSTDISSLASISGLGNFKSDDMLPIDEVLGREFIEGLDQVIDLRGDTFFNNFNPNHLDPGWKVFIKNLIGWQSEQLNLDEAVWQRVVRSYNENIRLELSPGGSLVVTVTHSDPNRSAKIANLIMRTIINNQTKLDKEQQDLQLEYLAQTLANALGDLEKSQSKLKNFTVENSSTPVEKFAVKTQELELLREQFNHADQIHKALAELSILIDTGSTKKSDYLKLRETFPIVDQVEFRRVLGQNEIISSWVWPKKPSVDAVLRTLFERRKRLEVELSLAQVEAANAAKSMVDYSTLKREATIAEATHTVLIERVKAQSMLAGFNPDSSRIFEFAAPPLAPSSPKTMIIIALSGLLGLFIGCIIALVVGSLRGVYYYQADLINSIHAPLNIKARTLLPARGIKLANLEINLSKRMLLSLRNIAAEIHSNQNRRILFTSLGSRLKSNDIAKIMAIYMREDNLKIALINFTTNQKIQNSQNDQISIGMFSVVQVVSKISVLQPNNQLGAIELLGQHDFQDQLEALYSKFDLIFLSADDDDAISLARASINKDVTHITATRIKRTKSEALTRLKKLTPIQGLLYE